MRFDVASLDPDVCARLMTATIVPRPIAWIVTLAGDGTRNAAPFSFFNALCSWPPVLGFGAQPRDDGSPKDTIANIRETGEFVVNLVSHAQAEAMNATAAQHPPDTDEIALAGLADTPSNMVAPPRVAEAPVAFECRLRSVIDIAGARAIILGDVVMIHVADHAILDPARGHVDGVALDLIGRMHGRDQYIRARDLFRLGRI